MDSVQLQSHDYAHTPRRGKALTCKQQTSRKFVIWQGCVPITTPDSMKPNKLIYALPLLAQIASIVMIEVIVFSNFIGRHGNLEFRANDINSGPFMAMALWLLLASISSIAAMIMYILFALQKNVVPAASRTMWIVALVLGGAIAQAIFYVKFILKTPKPTAAEAEAARKRDFWNQ